MPCTRSVHIVAVSETIDSLDRTRLGNDQGQGPFPSQFFYDTF